MKRLLLILGCLFGAAGVLAQGPVETEGLAEPARLRAEGAGLAFEESAFDFGRVARSLPKIEHGFEFVNEGTEPLVITRTMTSCNCVKVKYDKKPVPPGGKGVVTVIYEVNKKEAGVFYKVIEIYSNSVEKRASLIIKGVAVE